MKTCKNCLWADCCGAEGRCEYYTPAEGFDNIEEREYKEQLRERAYEYRKIVEEFAEAEN